MLLIINIDLSTTAVCYVHHSSMLLIINIDLTMRHMSHALETHRSTLVVCRLFIYS